VFDHPLLIKFYYHWDMLSCSRNRGFMNCIKNSLLCLTAVTLVCCSEIYCTECWRWVLRVIRVKVQCTCIGRHFTACGQWHCSLSEERYSEHYPEDTLPQAHTGMTAWIMCFTVNIICKILHDRWILVWQLKWCALHWTLSGRYFTAGG